MYAVDLSTIEQLLLSFVLCVFVAYLFDNFVAYLFDNEGDSLTPPCGVGVRRRTTQLAIPE